MSRLYVFLLAIFLVLSCTGKTVVETPDDTPGGTQEGFTLTVATYNVLKPEGRRTEMSMASFDVSQALARSVAETKADIIGFNELDETLTGSGRYSLSASCKSIVNYTWSLEWPNDVHEFTPPGYSYANGFAFNNKKLKLEESGYVWLSKEDDAWYVKPSSAYLRSGSPERTCIWARMTRKASKKEFWLFVTHLPTSSQGGAYNMAAVVNRYAAQKAGDAPAILTGDMNSAPGSAAYRRLISYWKDGNTASWGTLSGSSTKYYYPADQFTTDRSDRRIDHIMTRGCTAFDYHTVVVTYIADGQAWCPSDHLPVVATVEFD
ncbi:MAG: endonuclease/exonuclease/phosphatase family protein [Bacteroidales bacterium]|nr:endonuclease/exonuclease/phosphatase family protein [Bacteroidales bacterium]